MNNSIAGLDIGSANLKYVIVDSNKEKIINSGCIPLWSKKISLVKKVVGAVKYIVETAKPECINIVTSFEIVKEKPVHTLEEFYETLLDELNIPIYTITKDCTVIDMRAAQKKASELVGSSVQSAAYAGTHIIDDGILITMNSASTIVIPIVEKEYCPISNYKFDSGEARWIGALYTPVINFLETGIIYGHITKLAPYGAHTVDIFNILNRAKLEQALDLYGIDKSIFSQEASFYKIFHSLTHFYAKNINETLRTQTKIFSLYVYYNLQNTIREMVFQVISALNLDPEATPIIIGGIGRDLILKNALQWFLTDDIERYIPLPLWTYIEAFGSALALLEKIENKYIDIAKIV